MRLNPIVVTLVAAGVVGGAAIAAPSLGPEEQIAQALAGRVAGTPTDCIWQRQIRSSHIVDGTAILYEMTNGTIFVNRPVSGAPFLHRDLALITRSYSDQLCNIDIVTLYDTAARFDRGSIGLGQFVPYPRPPQN